MARHCTGPGERRTPSRSDIPSQAAGMTIDLTQFHDAFFEESFEALDSMEAALLKLDIGAPDKELINTIFRVAHSIKRGSATFGFSDIASFTQRLQTVLGAVCSG